MFYFLLQRQRNSGVPYFINLDKPVTTLGRLNISFSDNLQQISRKHVRITRTAKNTCFIQDLCSRNGTFVNGTRIGKLRYPLNIGDVIGFGVTGFSEVEGFSCVLCANPLLPVSVKHEVIDISDDDETEIPPKKTVSDTDDSSKKEIDQLKIANKNVTMKVPPKMMLVSDTDDSPNEGIGQLKMANKDNEMEVLAMETLDSDCSPNEGLGRLKIANTFSLKGIDDPDSNRLLSDCVESEVEKTGNLSERCEDLNANILNIKREFSDKTDLITDVVNKGDFVTQNERINDVRDDSVTARPNYSDENLTSCPNLSYPIKIEPDKNSDEVSMPNFIENDHASEQINLDKYKSLDTTCHENVLNTTPRIPEDNRGKIIAGAPKLEDETNISTKIKVKNENTELKSEGFVCTSEIPPTLPLLKANNKTSNKDSVLVHDLIAPKIEAYTYGCTSKTLKPIASSISPSNFHCAGDVKNSLAYCIENKESFRKKSTLESRSVPGSSRIGSVSNLPVNNLHTVAKLSGGKKRQVSESEITDISEFPNCLENSSVHRLTRETVIEFKVDRSNNSRRRSSLSTDTNQSNNVQLLDFSCSSGSVDVIGEVAVRATENGCSDTKMMKFTATKLSKTPRTKLIKSKNNNLEQSKICDEEVKKLQRSSTLRNTLTLTPLVKKNKEKTIGKSNTTSTCTIKNNAKSSFIGTYHINFMSRSGVCRKPITEKSSLEAKSVERVKFSELKSKDTKKDTVTFKRLSMSKNNSELKIMPPKTNDLSDLKATCSKKPKVAHVKPLIQPKELENVPMTRSLSSTYSPLQLDESTNLQHKVRNIRRDSQTKIPTDPRIKALPLGKNTSGNSQLSNEPSVSSVKRIYVSSETKLSSKVDSNIMVLKILYWNTSWLEEQTRNSKPPPQISEGATRLPLCFDSIDNYASIFFSFLLLETWEVVFKKWKQSVRENFVNDRFHFVTKSNNSWTDTMEIQCEAVVNSSNFIIPFEGCIVIVDVMKNTNERSSVFGYITKHKVEPLLLNNLNDSWRSLSKESLGKSELCKFSIKVRRKTFFPLGELMTAYIMCSITRNLHLADGLNFLTRSKLAKDILKPREETFTTISSGPQKTIIFRPFNYNQSQLIFAIGNEILQSKDTPKIALIHGAPGTGKTVTAIGLVKYLLCSSGLTQRILLLAPSNSAVDFIGKLLIDLSTEAEMPKFRFIRLGPEKVMNSEMLPYSLTKLATAAYENEKAEFDQKVLDLEESISCLTYEISTISSKSTFELNEKRSKLQAYHSMRRFYQNREKNYFSDEREFKIRVLKQANIILSTLRASRHPLVVSAFTGILNPFSCCIVDEATQCTELDLLQPLMFPVHKLVLFGNEQQLSPIIYSQLAKDCNFAQSLFERFHLYFLNNSLRSPVCQLDDQCRMHSAIGSFPSQYFYGNSIKFSQVLDLSSICPLISYAVIDFSASMVDSFKHYIISIVKQIVRCVPAEYSVGVVVPGQEDCEYFYNIFTEYGINSIQVEVNTDLGFQGREKEVMVVVCYSINSAKPGYLSCDRRLNIALTRACYSLFVCGIMSWLSHLDVWGALITDARRRGAYASIQSPNDASFILSKIVKEHGSAWVNIANIP